MMQVTHPVVAFLFYWGLSLIGVFILFNLFLAIIVDAFADVKRSASGARTLAADVGDIVRDAFLDFAGKFKKGEEVSKYRGFISDRELRSTLSVWLRQRGGTLIVQERIAEVKEHLLKLGADPETLSKNDADNERVLNLCEDINVTREEFEDLIIPRPVLQALLDKNSQQAGAPQEETLTRQKLAELKAMPELQALLHELWARYLKTQEMNEFETLKQLKVGLRSVCWSDRCSCPGSSDRSSLSNCSTQALRRWRHSAAA